jgi:16S rRNA (cytosine967-C5)-methyltransferase
VLARRPEARYHQSASALKSLEKLQDEILNDTAPATKPAGLLLYSTCSVWPEENQHRVAAFLQRHPDFELLEEKSTLPSLTPEPAKYRDGGYYALLRRKPS